MPIVTIITDFGWRDHYAAAMKGVILQIAPKTTIVDVTHDIPRHDVLHGAFVLCETAKWFPPGTVHLAVVDPGVGTARRIIVGRYGGQFVVAPDNGLISFLHQQLPAEEVRVLENPRLMMPLVSSTFHGRDVMAPAAAHLAAGRRLQEFGPLTDRVDALKIAHAVVTHDHCLLGQIIHVDGFGNLITNIGVDDLKPIYRWRPDAHVYVAETSVGPVRQTYADVAPGEPIALVGSSGLLEVSVNGGSAQDRFRPPPGTAIELK